MSRPLWFVQLIKKTFPNRFLVARATRSPIVGGILDRWLFEDDDLVYLPQDRVIQVGQSLDAPDSVVLPSRVVEHFIEQASVHWIMDVCICRDAEQCANYPIDLGCLFLGEAALGINPKLGRRVSKEKALAHARRCREAGLVHMIGRNKLDTVWLGVGPGERLLTICNCCPCCCLWRVLPHIAPHIGAKVTRMEGVTVTVSDRCVGCGTCTQDVCFADAIHLVGNRAVISDACRGCGRCVEICPQSAIEISIEQSQFVERTIARITPLVNIS
ncbi:MAG: 4Fe-4S ferredoxin [Anaerolineaceae bacterium 4572_32.2]|nr:MAG: 4Fe-4S ferredoxin [Anaerolineaceae bacterium 4572_32.2]